MPCIALHMDSTKLSMRTVVRTLSGENPDTYHAMRLTQHQAHPHPITFRSSACFAMGQCILHTVTNAVMASLVACPSNELLHDDGSQTDIKNYVVLCFGYHVL